MKIHGRVPERPKGADCKSVVTDYDGSNPSPSTKSNTPRVGYWIWQDEMGEFENISFNQNAGMAELADAYGSGPYGGNSMEVQVLLPAPLRKQLLSTTTKVVFLCYQAEIQAK